MVRGHSASWWGRLVVVVALCGLGSACAPASGGTVGAPASAPGAAKPAGTPALAMPTPQPAAADQPPDVLAHTITTLAYSYWPTIIGQTKGFFAARRIELDVTLTPRIPDSARGMAAGSFQTGSYISDGVLLAVEQGAPLALVGLETSRAIYDLAVPPTVTSFEDLRGKTFAVGAINDITAASLRRTLRLNGLGPNDYDLVTAGSTPERYAALVSGQVAGVLLTPPLTFRAQREGFRSLVNLAEILPPYTFATLTVNRDWAEANRDAVVRWLAAMLESVRWLYDPANRDEAVAILADTTKTSIEDAQATYSLVVENLKAFPPDLRVTPAEVDALLELMREVGTAPATPPDVNRLIDNSYLEAARRLVEAR
ncbi:MAG: ABC transporter substrate-binding protein [Chloroflexi bacterium]|nr:ABC transporter substrate-binding protein [Chloroflexota bacterium]